MNTIHRMDLDICQCQAIIEKVRTIDSYAQNLYAAMCNQEWQHQDIWSLLADRRWSCSWRTAGAIVADIRGQGDYMDWYCSGSRAWNLDDDLADGYVSESVITTEIRWDLEKIGWQPVESQD